ncbi:hypothetical protein DWB79_00360 [Treponema medium]|uniref:Ig-like domain-containing protein n=2 Tax=Treponema medium TaxID=58231 RepID=A0AA87TFY7_TREMD|nr:hypothetical protein [Treponema medium]EPF30059.1 hypothetical protein HMPREF9195_00071 [Treponema medium ATCC 700293]QSH96238.1 hypothetical protein DWB79_00360 [Treponema medium]
MKKLRLISVSILFAALCIIFTACNQGLTAGKGTGEVRIVIDNGATRAVNAEGMPQFDESNTKITVTGEDGNQLAEGTTSVTLTLDIGKKISIKVVVTTEAGEWRGTKEHTVTAGTNTVAVKLSKTPKSMKNILVDDVEQGAFGDATVTLKLANGETPIDHVQINGNYIIPVTARDGIGRIYMLYDKSGRHFTRFDTEGKIDFGFESAIMGVLPSTIEIKAMTVDPKTNRIFVVDGDKHVHAVTETGHNTFTRSDSVDLATLPDIVTADILTAVAAYNGELFLTVQRNRSPSLAKPNKLFACTAALSGTTLTLTEKNAAELDELRTSAVMNVPTQCTGLFADASGVYCLLREQRLDGGMLYYMVGALACYSRDDNTVTYLKKHPKAGTADAYLPFESASFANPVGFIGSDEDYIYIADDGINIKYLNENWRINGNKNRIAAFNRKTKEITFSDSDATWYAEKPGYKYPETPVLLWEKDTSGNFRYWVSTDGTSSAPAEATKIFQTTVPTNKITDIFCYDQEGNLYILWKESTVYCVTRFELKNGTYDFTQGAQLNLGITNKVVAIAADVSDGQKFLYCAAKVSAGYTIQQRTWASNFTSAAFTSYNVTLPSDKDVTALAANKDGVFVGVRAINVSPAGYTLSVNKYAKQDGVDKGTITVGELQLTPTEPSGPYPPYTKIESTINDLRIVDGMLYAITSKLEKRMAYRTGDYGTDEFKSSGRLYKIAEAASFSGNAMVLHAKYPVLPQGTSRQGVGYGFYRFIAVKPKKLVIASGGAYAIGGNALASSSTQPDRASDNKVMTYDLDGNLQEPEEKNAGGTFSQKLSVDGSGFNWE